MNKQQAFFWIVIASCTAAAVVAQKSSSPADPLTPLQALEGAWQGESRGFGQVSKVTHEWERVLGGKFLRLKTRSVTKNQDGSQSIHEDVGYVSWSPEEGLLRFRQFLSEGYVNTFSIEEAADPDSGFNFEPESNEGTGGQTARMTLRFGSPDSYTMALELGAKGGSLKRCQTMTLKRVR